MRPLVLKLVVVAIAAVAAVSGGVAGWYLHGPAKAGPATLEVIAAGSLSPTGLMPHLVATFVAETPGVQSPLSAQLYQGSTADAAQLAGGHQPYDIFISADYRVIPESLEAPKSTVATWEVAFAGDPLVLAYDPSVSAFSGTVTPANWYTDIVKAGVTLGSPNASGDPLGVDAILAIELEDALENQSGALYGHFFTGAQGALAGFTSATKEVSENDAATALNSSEVQAYFVYRSYAKSEGLTYTNLFGKVNLGGTTSADISAYGGVSTTVLTGTGSATSSVVGAPIVFALTVPATAPDAPLGIAFAAFLLSNSTSAIWLADGFAPLAPAYVDHPSALPGALAGSPPEGPAPMPSYLTALIT